MAQNCPHCGSHNIDSHGYCRNCQSYTYSTEIADTFNDNDSDDDDDDYDDSSDSSDSSSDD